jgi:hypothetical protein
MVTFTSILQLIKFLDQRQQAYGLQVSILLDQQDQRVQQEQLEQQVLFLDQLVLQDQQGPQAPQVLQVLQV